MFRVVDAMQIVEKFACSGVLDQTFYKMVANFIREKTPEGVDLPDSLDDLEKENYSLISDRPLFSLFRFVSKQGKHGRQRNDDGEYIDKGHDESDSGVDEQCDFYQEETVDVGCDYIQTDIDVNSLFENASLPLLLDLGCGYGVSLLGWGFSDKKNGKYNFLGCDMSLRAINYANGISRRWDIKKNCMFIVADVVNALKMVNKYKGPIHLVSINFPTPYRQDMIPGMIQKYFLSPSNEGMKSNLSTTNQFGTSCNSQLPSDMSDFMVTSEVLNWIEVLFERSLVDSDQTPFLYMQSNVQDVAVVMNEMWHHHVRKSCLIPKSMLVLSETKAIHEICNGGVKENTTSHCGKRKTSENDDLNPPKRQSRWVECGGKTSIGGYAYLSQEGSVANTCTLPVLVEDGDFWLEKSPLPSFARTETEVMCKFYDKPIYRQLFSFHKTTESSK